MNLVLDDVKEKMRGMFYEFPYFGGEVLTDTDESGKEATRSLGLIVARGTLLVLISPADGSEEIANPFVQAEE